MIGFTRLSIEKIRAHGDAEAPKEACGVMAGKAGKGVVNRVFPCANVDENPLSAYTIEPEELLRIITEIESGREGLELIGFYHTHPFSSPRPSRVDVARATWDGFCYAIYSLIEDELRCWRWNEDPGVFREEDVRMI